MASDPWHSGGRPCFRPRHRQHPRHAKLHLRVITRLGDDIVHFVVALVLKSSPVPFEYLVPCEEGISVLFIWLGSLYGEPP